MQSKRPKCFCENRYDQGIHQPKKLPQCTHTLCATCCLKQYEDSKKVTCQQCQKSSENHPMLYEVDTATLFLTIDNSGQCSKHNGQTKILYCFDHQELLCTACPYDGTHQDHRIRDVESAAAELRQGALPECQTGVQRLLDQTEEKIARYQGEVQRVSMRAKEMNGELLQKSEELITLIMNKVKIQQDVLEQTTSDILQEFNEKITKCQELKELLVKRLTIDTSQINGILKFITKSKKIDGSSVEQDKEQRHEFGIHTSVDFQQDILPHLINLQWAVDGIQKLESEERRKVPASQDLEGGVEERKEGGNAIRPVIQEPKAIYGYVKKDSNIAVMFNLDTKESETRRIKRKLDSHCTFVTIIEGGILLTGSDKSEREKQIVTLIGENVKEQIMLNARFKQGVEYRENKAYIIGGYNKDSIPECEMFSLTTSKSSSLPSHPIPIHQHGTALTLDALLTIGGKSSNGVLQSSIYEFLDNKWSKKSHSLTRASNFVKGNYIPELNSCLIFSTHSDLKSSLMYDFQQVHGAGEDFAQRTKQYYFQYYNGKEYKGKVYNAQRDRCELWSYDVRLQEWNQC